MGTPEVRREDLPRRQPLVRINRKRVAPFKCWRWGRVVSIEESVKPRMGAKRVKICVLTCSFHKLGGADKGFFKVLKG